MVNVIALPLIYRYFFSLCDGIFLNYHWKRQFLADTQMMVGNARSKDVFVGIDVFGRGTFGGGGFNCSIVNIIFSNNTKLLLLLFFITQGNGCNQGL